MRIGIGRLCQETNTFSPVRTTLGSFGSEGILAGEEILCHLDRLPELKGAVEVTALRSREVDLVPIFSATAWPAGRLAGDAHEFLQRRFLEQLEGCGPLDGLFLSLHGALAAEGCDDVEGELLSCVRAQRARSFPVAISLDLHANVTQRMVTNADIMVGYHTSPHLDIEETGARAMEILLETVSGQVNPQMAWRKIPMVVPADRHNHAEGPLCELIGRVRVMEETGGIISSSLFAVQPWLDVEELGWATVAISDGDRSRAQLVADEIAFECWQKREEFIVDKPSPAEAVRQALDHPSRPVVISDSSDSTNSGAPGNSTRLLSEFIAARVSDTVYLTMVAPDVVEQAYAAGVGARLSAVFGVKPVNPFTSPIGVDVLVRSLHDGTVVLSGHMGKHLRFNMGRTAVLTARSITIVASESVPPGHVPPEFFRQLGLDVRDAKIIVAKSPVGFRAGYEGVAAGIVLCEGPGPACSQLTALPFERRPRPLYPFERGLEWSLPVTCETREGSSLLLAGVGLTRECC